MQVRLFLKESIAMPQEDTLVFSVAKAFRLLDILSEAKTPLQPGGA